MALKITTYDDNKKFNKDDMLTQSTIDTYKSNISRLDKYLINYKNFSDPNELIDTIYKIGDISDATVKNYLTAVMWYYKTNDLSNDGLSILSKKISDINKEKVRYYDKNKMTEKEENKHLDWNEINTVYNKLYSQRNNSATAFKKCITIALYVLFPPRRLKDYSNMCCVDKVNNISENCNCYVMEEKKFIFCEYKTSKMLGRQVVEISNDLDNLLKEYVHKFSLIGKEILGCYESDLSNKIKRIFTKYTGKPATVNTLRHSYIIHQSKNGHLETTEDKKKLAYNMAHSHTAQQDVYLKV